MRSLHISTPFQKGDTVSYHTILDGAFATSPFSRLYEAVHRDLRHHVVIKQSTSTEVQDHDRFRYEAKILNILRNTGVNLPHLYQAEVDVFDHGYYIIYSLFEGENLLQYIRKGVGMTQVVDIMFQLMHILVRVHKRNVIHRDLKPDNVLISPKGEVGLTDFGIARLLTDKFTGDEEIFGSPAFMAPEQYRGYMYQTVETDIYALGKLFYSLTVPDIDAPSSFRDYQEFLDDHARFGQLLDASGLSTRVIEVIKKATRLEQYSRYPTIESFAVGLRNAL